MSKAEGRGDAKALRPVCVCSRILKEASMSGDYDRGGGSTEKGLERD